MKEFIGAGRACGNWGARGRFRVFRCPSGIHARGVKLVKPAAKKNNKPAPVDNPEAVAAMAAERRARLDSTPSKFESKRTAAREQVFLDTLAQGWSVKKSAWTAGVSSDTVRNWRSKSETTRQEDGTYLDDFAVRWETAWCDGVDVLEDAAHHRGVVGVERPVYQGGLMVGTTTEYSDTLLNLALRGKRPERYNTERHELTGANGGPMAMSMEIEFVSPPAGNKT